MLKSEVGKRRVMQDSLWQAVLGEIEVTISRGHFVTWFKKTRLLKHSDNVMIIGVQNVFVKQQMEKRFSSLISEVLEKNGVRPERIEFKIDSSISSTKKAEEEPVVLKNPENKTVRPATTPQPTLGKLTHSYRQGLNEKYTFDNFIVGSGNELAYAACQAIAQQPGTKYNPLFIYGGVGIGKTHLIQAVGNGVIANNPQARVVYVTTEQFVQEFIDAVRFKKNTDFAGYYRAVDVLILDDVQFIAGKDKTQEEFFHTFNALHQANKQIIISSDRPPKDIPTLEDRLKSRFSQGMSIDMQIPDFETRCAIIQTKAEQHNIHLPPDVVEYLANLIRTNIRELEGALNKILAWCEMHEMEPNLELASSLLHTGRSKSKHISPRVVIERTAKHFSIQLEDIMSAKRDKDIVVPRQVAMYILRHDLRLSYPKIAQELGRKDHTTAMHSVEKIEKEMNLNPDIREAIRDIKERLNA